MADQPAFTAPPPAPPAAGGFPWKWVLIGCGTITFLGLLLCGGCMWLGYNASKEMIAAVKSLEANPKVEALIGKYDMVQGTQNQTTHPDQSITQSFQLKGERGNGKIELTFKLEGISIKIRSKVFVTDGDAVNAAGLRVPLD